MTKNPDSHRFRAFRAFLVALFAVVGAFMGLILIIIALVFVFAFAEEETLSSDVKIMPDANGNRKELAHTTPILLYVPISGEIGKDEVTAHKLEEILLKSREGEFKDRVKGLLLVINSPGGDVNDSDIIYRHVLKYKERYKVPVIAFVDGLAASGGYYIACAADKIYASDVSLVGSIGVLSWPPYYNVVDLLKKVGVDTMTLTAGKGKDNMNPTRPWKPDEQKQSQEIINYFYDRFVSIVTHHRPLISAETLKEDLGAHVFPAPLALQHGYIDGASYSYGEAVSELAKAADLKDKYQVVKIETKEWFKKLFKEKSFLYTGKIQHEIKLPEELELQNSTHFKYLY